MFTRDLNWVAALRARAGYSWKRVLGYVTGGPALGNISHSFTTTDTVNAFTQSGGGSYRPGWQYGGGVEFRIGGPLTVGLEYLHTMLRDGAYTVNAGMGASGIKTGFEYQCGTQSPYGSNTNCSTNIQRTDAHYNVDSVRLVTSFRF